MADVRIQDLVDLPSCHYFEVLEMLKLKAIDLEHEIEKTDKIDSPTEARGHVQHMERKLIKVMPMMNLLSDLLKFSRMFEEQKHNQPGMDSLVVKQEESIKVVVGGKNDNGVRGPVSGCCL